MNKFIRFSLVNALSVVPGGMICNINTSGDVTLEQYIINSKENQKVVATIGRENWNEPYKFRTICEQLKAEVGTNIGVQWVSYGCEGLLGVERKVLEFNLSEKGQGLLKNQRNTLLFYPAEPIEKSFLRNLEEPACDPL